MSREWIHVARVDELRGKPGHQASTLEADLAFCHPAIVGIDGVDLDRGEVRLRLDADVYVGADGNGDLGELDRMVRAVVAMSVASHRFADPGAPSWSHRAAANARGAELATFVERHLRPLGPGRWALVGAAAEARAAIDARLRQVASTVAAEPWHLPSVEEAADLIPRTGYFASHPQHVCFGYRLPCHFEKLNGFAAAARERSLASPAPEHGAVPTGFILEPFVCHNVYLALRGQRLDANRAITALGTCYRYEGFRFRPLVRQWEFSMREVVLVGSPAFVADRQRLLEEATCALGAQWDLDVTLEVATDPFFVAGAASARAFQTALATKRELRASLGGGDSTALASFNTHGRHFTEPMEIRGASGETDVETACVGWGLERWMAALACRWGAATEEWPLQ